MDEGRSSALMLLPTLPKRIGGGPAVYRVGMLTGEGGSMGGRGELRVGWRIDVGRRSWAVVVAGQLWTERFLLFNRFTRKPRPNPKQHVGCLACDGGGGQAGENPTNQQFDSPPGQRRRHGS